MSAVRFSNIQIKGIVTIVPEDIRTVEDESYSCGLGAPQIEKIKTFVGCQKRHVAKPEITTFDLCSQAARKLLHGLQIDKSSIDSVISVTTTNDFLQPGNSFLYHGDFGFKKECVNWDIILACSGYVQGLLLAFMQIEVGLCSRVLLLAGDTPNRVVYPKDRSVAYLFGDAGSATLIEKTTKNETIYFNSFSNGHGVKHLYLPAGGYRLPFSEATKKEFIAKDGAIKNLDSLHLDGAEIFNFSIGCVPDAITELLKLSGFDRNEIDYFILHQANKLIIDSIAQCLQLPSQKVPSSTLAKYGNQASASIPATICDVLNKDVTEGRKLLLLAGYGQGLSWSNCILHLEKIFCPLVQIYEKEGI